MTRRERHQLRCQCCGLLFPSMTINAKWCSNACNQHAFRQRRKAAALMAQPAVINADDELPPAWREHQDVAAIAPFAYQGRQIRVTTDEHGVTWFVAADVCAVLDISNPSDALSRLDDDEKTLISNEGQGRREAPTMNAVNEPGLYSLILGSRKPEAKAFKRWITHEVLPAIRRTGSYGVPAAPTLTPGIHVVARSQRQASWLWAEAVERHVGAALMLDIAHGPRTQAQPTFQLHLLPTT